MRQIGIYRALCLRKLVGEGLAPPVIRAMRQIGICGALCMHKLVGATNRPPTKVGLPLVKNYAI